MEDNEDESYKKKPKLPSGNRPRDCDSLTEATIMSPPSRRQTSPTIFPLLDLSQLYWKRFPTWATVLAQVAVTLPLYIFSFWLMIEGIKAGGDKLIMAIDYLAFRP